MTYTMYSIELITAVMPWS